MMFIRLYDDDERDLYVQLADEIIRLIAEGTLTEGDELPSIRKLASRLQVNTKTVQAAYQKLADEGFIILRKKATAIVHQAQFNEQEWLQRWRNVLTRFQYECRARNLSEQETMDLVHQLLTKEGERL
ncbi:MAG TPA: GntR family transcriptional regulator [Sporosarcina sp.]|nr:GntR family transcriptional regulator [Sporosarcina sp.]